MKTLREWRTERLISVRTLAALSSVQHKTIIQIELGRQQPQYATMSRVAHALGVPAAQIAEFAEALDERAKKRNPAQS